MPNSAFRAALTALLCVTLVSTPVLAQVQEDCPNTLFPSVYVGGEGVVSPGEPNNLRAEPTADAELVGQIPAGGRFNVLGGPACADGYNWYQVEYDGIAGWTVGGDATTTFLEGIQITRFQGYHAYDDHLAFTFESDVADYAMSHFHLATLPQGVEATASPEYVEINLSRYDDSTGGTLPIDDARVTVFTNSTMVEGSNYGETVEQVAADLAAGEMPGNLITLPGATRVTSAHQRALNFGGGQGISAVAIYNDNADLITNDVLRYVYQGVTDDGQYSVVVEYPLRLEGLPDTMRDIAEVPQGEQAYFVYLQQVTAMLEATDENAFTPSLTALDRMVESITITPPEATLTVLPDADSLATYALPPYSFHIDPTLASRLEVVVRLEDPQMLGMYGASPAETAFQLLGYPVYDTPRTPGQNIRLQSPAIFFTPAGDFEQRFSPDESAFIRQFERIRQFMDSSADLSQFTGSAAGLSADGTPTDIPALPLYNAAQVFVAQPEYVAYEGEGRQWHGVRFLTAYSQAPIMVSERELFYQFTAVSDDGEIFISATFPLVSGVLPEEIQIPEDYEAFMADYTPYLREVTAALNAVDPDAFTPSLNVLDAVVESIRIE